MSYMRRPKILYATITKNMRSKASCLSFSNNNYLTINRSFATNNQAQCFKNQGDMTCWQPNLVGCWKKEREWLHQYWLRGCIDCETRKHAHLLARTADFPFRLYCNVSFRWIWLIVGRGRKESDWPWNWFKE